MERLSKIGGVYKQVRVRCHLIYKRWRTFSTTLFGELPRLKLLNKDITTKPNLTNIFFENMKDNLQCFFTIDLKKIILNLLKLSIL
jgi:hypothetical protein